MSLHIAKIGVEHVAYYMGQTHGGGGPSPAADGGGGTPTAGGGSCGGGHGKARGGAPPGRRGYRRGWGSVGRLLHGSGRRAALRHGPHQTLRRVAPTTLRPDAAATREAETPDRDYRSPSGGLSL